MSAPASAPCVLAGRYRLDTLIGRGGMGSVFSGEQLALGRACAVKLLEARLCKNEVARQRFAREARQAGRIVHENVVALMDYDVCAGVPFLVMELLHGETLRSLLRREGELPLSRAMHITIQICRGLSAAHQLQTVHRDLTPNNVYLTRRADGSDLVKLLDFGIAKSADEVDDLTQDGALLGSVRYMAPEQLRDPKAVDVRADLYSAGLILYEMLAGRPAFASQDLHTAVQQTLYEGPPALGELRPQLPEGLLKLVERAISPDPERRFASAGELLGALQACDVARRSAPTEATTKSESKERAEPVRSSGEVLLARGTARFDLRRRRSIWAGSLLLVTAIALLGLLLRSTLAGSAASVAPRAAAASAAQPAAQRPGSSAALPALEARGSAREQDQAAPRDDGAPHSAEAQAAAASAAPQTAPLVSPASFRRVARRSGPAQGVFAASAPAPRADTPAPSLVFDRDNPY